MSISYFHFHFDGAALCVVFVSLFVFVLIILYQQRIKTKREHKTYPKSGAYERAKRTHTQKHTHTLAHISCDVRRANEHNWPDIRVALAPREPAVPEQRTQQKHVLRQILVHMYTYVSRYAHTSVRTDRAEVTYQN